MQEAVQAGVCSELILSSPHPASFQAFVNATDPEHSGLHRLLQDLFPWDIPRISKAGQEFPRIEYLGYRVANLPRRQPNREFFESKRSYECLLKIRLAICENGRREEGEYLLAHLPWITTRDTFVRNGLEIVPLAQLLPATGILFARKKRPESKVGEEFISDIRSAHGLSLRLRCRQSAKETDTQTLLLASVQVGRSKRKNVWQFFRDLFGPDSRDFQGFEDRLGQLFASVDEEELTPEETEQREVETEALYRQLFNVKVLGGFDFGAAGRTQFNRRLSPAFSHLGLTPSSGRELTPEDLLAALCYLAVLAHGKDAPFATVVDDLEHLANKRVRLVGDFLEDALWWSLLKAREEACSALRYYGEIDRELERCFLTVDEAVQKVFALGPLFQLLDTTNPLATVSHKRTVTLRGPGGIESEFGNLEKRDVHPSHYGCLCPCETPESEDIGLTLHLATYAQVQDGHLVTPVSAPGKNGEVIWLKPEEENNLSLCTRQELSPERRRAGRVLTRRYTFSGIPATPTYNEAAYVKEEEVAYHDIALEQQLGLAACLVPFLRHSDANRVLMGAKNLKQALPLLKPEVPLVRTGMEEVVARLYGEDPAGEQEGARDNARSRAFEPLRSAFGPVQAV